MATIHVPPQLAPGPLNQPILPNWSFSLLSAHLRASSNAAIEQEALRTAGSEQTALDGDPGYRLFVYRAIDPKVLDTLKDLTSSKSIAIGYGRTVGGMDVLVPLDLTVVDSEYSEQQEVIRKVSPEVIEEFAQCTSTVPRSVSEK